MSPGEPCFSATTQRRQPTALVIEEFHGLAATFQNLGFCVVRHQHRALNTGITNGVPREIKQGVYAVVCSEFPLQQHIRKTRAHAHRAALCSWARRHDVGIPLLITGSAGTLKHHSWADDQIHKMVRDQRLHITYHRICHFGVKVDTSRTEPSASSIAIAATVDLPQHPCVCRQGTTHVRDWGVKPTSSQDKPRWRAQCAMAQKAQKVIDYFHQKRNTADGTRRHRL